LHVQPYEIITYISNVSFGNDLATIKFDHKYFFSHPDISISLVWNAFFNEHWKMQGNED
jgi:hypothetical protein